MRDDRLKKNLDGGGRESRATHDSERAPATDALESTRERRKMFRNEWVQESLPKPPDIPGFHVCWLSTTNSYDPIHKRLRMGYELVRYEEVPGFENYKVKAGEHTGAIACNEMLLYKMPEEIYQESWQNCTTGLLKMKRTKSVFKLRISKGRKTATDEDLVR